MKISIIMGVYNCKDTLDEAIMSIMDQTYEDWEFIICDDGSTDNTYNVAYKYKQHYPNQFIILKNECNKGLNYTLNQCLKYASGEYIARMDGDDISLPNRFETQIQFLQEHKEYSFVSCSSIYFDNQTEIYNIKKDGEPAINRFAIGSPFCHAASMIKKVAYDAVGGYNESKTRKRVEDYDLWIRMYEMGLRGYNLSTPLYKIREDFNAYKRRKYRYRINEFLVSISAVYKLKLPAYLYIYSLRPLLVGLLPKRLYIYLHNNKLSKKK